MPRKGGKVAEEAKAKASATQIANFRRRLAEQKDAEQPAGKRCSKCECFKPLEDFYHRKQTLRSGVVALRPEPRCKPCRNAEVAARRLRLKEEGKWVPYSEDPAKKRRRRRELEAIQRRKQGSAVHLQAVENDVASYLPAQPLREFLIRVLEGRTMEEVAAEAGVDARRIRAVISGEVERVQLPTVDRILVGLNRLEEFNFLYPIEEEPKVGYYFFDVATEAAA